MEPGPADGAGPTEASSDDGLREADHLDAGKGAEDAAPPCTNDDAHLCDDFDTLPLNGGRWDVQRVTGDASLAIDDAAAASRPSSLLVVVPASSSPPGERPDALLFRRFHGPTSGLECRFLLRGVSVPPGTIISAFYVQTSFRPDAGLLDLHDVALFVTAGDSVASEYFHARDGDGGEVRPPIPFSDIRGGFVAFTVTVAFGDAPGSATLRVRVNDEEKLSNYPLQAFSPQDVDSVEVGLGLSTSNGVPVSVRYDDVSCVQR